MPGKPKAGKISKTVTLDAELVDLFETDLFQNHSKIKLSPGLELAMRAWLDRSLPPSAHVSVSHPTHPKHQEEISQCIAVLDSANPEMKDALRSVLKAAMAMKDLPRSEPPERPPDVPDPKYNLLPRN